MKRCVPAVSAGLLLLLVSGGSGAEQYLVNAAAGNAGDAHVNNDDPDAYASFQRSEAGGGAESYQAGANASSGQIYARASRVDPLPPAAITTGAAASIAETIHFDELPEDSVTVTATLGVGVIASKTKGFANASASLQVGSCYVTKGYSAGGGPSSGGNCPGSETGTVHFTLTRNQLIQSGGELDVSVNVSAQLESQGGIEGFAEVSGGAGLVNGLAPPETPEPGTIYLVLDPPLAISYSGTQTFFPAPEPEAPLLAVACGATLFAMRRSRRRD